MGSLAKGFLRKVCGNSAESSRKLRFVAPGKGAESLRKFRGNLRKIFCNDPFPNDPISKLLSFHSLSKDFRGSAKKRTLVFSGFPKSKGWRVRVCLVEHFCVPIFASSCFHMFLVRAWRLCRRRCCECTESTKFSRFRLRISTMCFGMAIFPCVACENRPSQG